MGYNNLILYIKIAYVLHSILFLHYSFQKCSEMVSNFPQTATLKTLNTNLEF